MAHKIAGSGTKRSGRCGIKTAGWKVDPARSALMARIGSRNTSPELRVRQVFHRTGLRYRIHPRSLPGRPDLAFPSRRLVVFVHGCFWHRHPGCKSTRNPKSRLDFWNAKFTENMERDVRVRALLTSLGWSVLVIWECETHNREHLLKIALKIKALPMDAKK
jgi:DNA mismatch endonuclease, patch repair protein